MTGLQIKGITLYTSAPPSVGAGALPQEGYEDPATMAPDPTAAVWGADDAPGGTDWPLVVMTGSAALAVVGLFLLAVRHAAKASK